MILFLTLNVGTEMIFKGKMMKLFLLLAVLFTGLFAEEDDIDLSDIDNDIHPSEFTVKLIKNCETLVMKEEPDRNSKEIFTRIWNEGCVQNYGCLREVTQKELDAMDEKERAFAAWKYPVWCKVNAKGQVGWVRKQFLSDEPCK
jgi:hypothetical protein